MTFMDLWGRIYNMTKDTFFLNQNSFRWTESVPDVPEFVMLGYRNIRKANTLPDHTHPGCFEFVLVEKGKAAWEIQGEVFETFSGDVFHTRPGEPHRGRFNIIEPSEIWYLIVQEPRPPQWLQLYSHEYNQMETALYTLPRVFHTSLNDVLPPLIRLRRVLYGSQPLRSIEIRLLILEFLILLLQPDSTSSPDFELERLMKRVITFIEQSLEERPSVEQLASIAGLSPSYFYRVFKQYTGFSPMSYIERIRIEEACRLLNSDISITQISHLLGFSSSQHFATSFKKSMGVTPTFYKKM